MSAITIPDEGTIAYSNFQWSRPRTITYPGNLIRTQTYDPLMRAATIKIKNASDAVLMDYGYTYDAVGNITKKTTEHGAYQYGYDPLDRLTSADYPNGQDNDQINTTFDANTFPFKDDQFTYDLLGNRLTDQAQTTTAPWQYNANNELLNSALNQYAYNDNGSTVEKKQPDAEIEQRYVYNTEERLAEVKDASDQSIATYYYDPFGRRLWKTVAANQPGNESATPRTTYLYYSDEGYAAEYVHAGNHPNSEASITPTLSQLYLFAPQGLWSTEPVAIQQTGENGGWRYTETDHLGTPHGLISKAGEETTDLRANVFGQTELNGEALSLRFAGQTEDDETGGYYNFHRDYEPNLGRYTQHDPIELRGGVNLLLYSKANPVARSDAQGLLSIDATCKAQAQAIRDAIEDAIEGMKKCKECKKGVCPENAEEAGYCLNPDVPFQIEQNLQDAVIRCESSAPPVSEAGHECGEYSGAIILNPNSFSPTCCPLASTLAHEAAHSAGASESQAYYLEDKCFGCTHYGQ